MVELITLALCTWIILTVPRIFFLVENTGLENEFFRVVARGMLWPLEFGRDFIVELKNICSGRYDK